MNNEQHTVGPWMVQALGLARGEAYPEWRAFCVRQAATNVHLATVGDVDRYYEGQHMANAQLIAAAPDMLAALRGCADTLREAGKGFALYNPHAARPNLYELHERVAREAIAKATGEQIGADMPVIVRLGDLVPQETTLSEFVRDNADGITLAETEAICTALAENRVYVGGGGAAAPFLIVRASRKAEIVAALAARGVSVEFDPICEEIDLIDSHGDSLEYDELPTDLQSLAAELARISCSSEPITGGIT